MSRRPCRVRLRRLPLRCLLAGAAVALLSGGAGAAGSAAASVAPAAPDTAGLRPFWWAIPDSVPTVYGIPVDSLAAPADSVWGFLPPIEVRGTTTTRRTGPSEVRIDALVLRERDPASAADLAPLLPATRLGVNSRGESQFMVRGAPERHLKILFAGIPLNVPWDERVDLGLVPVDAVGLVEASRGIGSVLHDPNAVAGTVELLPASLPTPGRRTRLSLRVGSGDLAEGRLAHLERGGSWQVLAALSRRVRSAFLLPDDLWLPHNQPDRRQRTNSDLEQDALLLRAERAVGERGRIALTLLGTDGSRGVPPEGHLADGARFWRYPVQRRAVLGTSLDLPLDAAGRWQLAAFLGGDLHRLEIHDYADSTYTGPAPAPGVDYETDRDRTGHARLRLTRRLRGGASLALQAVGRYTRHLETLTVGGPELAYSQWLGSWVGELDLRPAAGWAVRAGAGWEVAGTPESGDKPARDATGSEVAHLSLQRRLSERTILHASAGRRSRFPALRELYSGALGRFEPNPGLRPERQDLLELGLTSGGAGWSLGLGGFAGRLDGGIERIVVPGTNRYQRVNVDRIRTLGLEATATWRPRPELLLSAHHTVLRARREVDGAWTGPAEDRPDYLAYFSAGWSGAAGGRLGIELEAIGPRHSADPASPDGLTRLPAQALWNLRAGWLLRRPLGPVTRAELIGRLENVLDQRVDSQVGLPLAGRTLVVGIDLSADRWAPD